MLCNGLYRMSQARAERPKRSTNAPLAWLGRPQGARPSLLQYPTAAAPQLIERRLPFALLGLDSDNGSELINHHLPRYCRERRIRFTRSRPYCNNDNCNNDTRVELTDASVWDAFLPDGSCRIVTRLPWRPSARGSPR